MSWKFELLFKTSGDPTTEGPVWDGEYLYFTHIRASRIMRYDPKRGAITEWRTGTNCTNSLLKKCGFPLVPVILSAAKDLLLLLKQRFTKADSSSFYSSE